MSANWVALLRRSLPLSALLIALLSMATYSPLSAHPLVTGDLYSGDPAVGEHDLTSSDQVLKDNACGTASATMLLDYYLLQGDPLHAPLSIDAVRTDVPVNHYGTTGLDMENGIAKASAASDLGVNTQLTTAWRQTSAAHWQDDLEAELNAKLPVIAFIANGKTLGWKWPHSYGHYIFVTGYQDDGSIIYYDPWDGARHDKSAGDFAAAWGASWRQNPSWDFLEALPPGVNSPLAPSGTATATVTATATATATTPVTNSVIHGTITEFALPSANGHPDGITAGPDGNLWVTYDTNHISRIGVSGVITDFSIPQPGGDEGVWSVGIIAGPDGNLWFTENGGEEQPARITPSGHINNLPPSSDVFFRSRSIAAGPNGDLWITDFIGAVYRLTTSGGVTRFPLPNQQTEVGGITRGPDGNLWFTEGAPSDGSQVFGEGDSIGRITPGGSITEYPLPTAEAGAGGITAGSDGNLWFTEVGGNKIARITPTGAISEFPLPQPNSNPDSIIGGPDGNLWFTEAYGIGKITVHGDVTVFPVSSSFTGGPAPYIDPYEGITVGPNGNLWFIDPGANKIGEVS